MNCMDTMPLLFRHDQQSEVDLSSSNVSSSLESNCSLPEMMNNEAAIEFHYENLKQEIVVDENLAASHLCHLLTLKLNLNRSNTWSIVIQLPNYGIERILEDDEEVLLIYRQFAANKCKFILKQNFRKYDFFENASQYFLLDLITLNNDEIESRHRVKFAALQNQLNTSERLYMSLTGPLYLLINGQWRTNCVKCTMNESCLVCCDIDSGDEIILNIIEYSIYTPINDEMSECSLKSPSQHLFCLINEDDKKLHWFAAEDASHRQCWITSLKIAKYGLSQLRCNFQHYKKACSSSPGHSYYRINEECGKVFMDYSSKDGPRIIESPNDTSLCIAAHDKHLIDCKRRATNKSFSSNASKATSIRSVDCFEPAPHLSQPWFYGQMTREEASLYLEKYGTVDGVFLVRESHRNPSCFVLSFVYNLKIHHVQIQSVDDKSQTCLSLDCGKTRFYDLLQLVEFYQLNFGVLPTKLTHFLVHPKYHQH